MIARPQCWASATLIVEKDDDSDSRELVVPLLRPASASIHLNGYLQADTFEMSFFADDLPIRPDTIRAMAVQIYLFHTQNLESEPAPFMTPKNQIIVGLVDDPAWSLGAGGKVFSVTGRDYTQLLIDKPWPPETPIQTGDTLQTTIQNIVNLVQAGKLIGKHEYETDESQAAAAILQSQKHAKMEVVDWSSQPVVTGENDSDKKDLHRVVQKKERTKIKTTPKVGTGHSRSTKHRMPAKSGRNVWEVITELCQMYGKICYVSGTKIYIRDPAVLTQEDKDKALYVAHGRNLTELNIRRKLGHRSPPKMIASFYDPKTKARVDVQYPEKKKKLPQAYGTITQNFMRVTLPPGIADKEMARAYLRGRYGIEHKGEIEVSFQTSDVVGLESQSGQPWTRSDVMQLRPGNPVGIGIDSIDRRTIAEQKDPEMRFQYLKKAGFKDDVARLLADHYGQFDELRRFYYTKEVDFDWTLESFSTRVTAQNYARKAADAASSER